MTDAANDLTDSILSDYGAYEEMPPSHEDTYDCWSVSSYSSFASVGVSALRCIGLSIRLLSTFGTFLFGGV